MADQKQRQRAEHKQQASPGGKAAKGPHGLELPLARIKHMIKEEGEVDKVSAEASFLVAKATEVFISEVARRAASNMDSHKALAYKDVALVVRDWESLEFLQDVVPMKVSAATLLKQNSKE